MPAEYYYFSYLTFLFVIMLCLIAVYDKYYSVKGLYNNRKSISSSFIIFVIVSLFIGFRPLSGVFVDTMTYNYQFSVLKGEINYNPDSDKLFRYFMYYCAQFMSVSIWFTIIAMVYFGGMLLSCYRLFPKDTLFVFLVVLTAYSSFAYGTNGLRNGMATSFALLALTYRNQKVYALLLFLIATGIHFSMSLILLASIVSYFYKNTKTYVVIWIISIFLSIFFPGFFENLFAEFIVDKRRAYLTLEGGLYGGDGGFRWDFLLYSCVPVLVGFYFVFLQKKSDEKYKWILNTYIIANTFWILVMRASFSNRFAYLSWFLYPIVLIYPFLKFHYMKNQYKRASLVAFLHFCFTYFMMLIGK